MNDNMPPKVAEAIAAVMSEVPKLNKGERNSHGNYNFASIDDFLEAVRPLMAKHKLIISADEDDFDVIGEGKDMWLRMRFAFSAHCHGETYGPMRRSIMIKASMGSQAFGAGQSYAEKQFLRSLFKIATGEGANIDADSHPQEPLARTRSANTSPPPAVEPEQGWPDWVDGFKNVIGGYNDSGEIDELQKRNKAKLEALRLANPSLYAEIGNAIKTRRTELSPQQAAA